MRLPRRGAARSFVRRTEGGATLELALGVVALLTVASVTFDLYTRVETDSAGTRMAAAMADYVSRETAPDGDQMVALGTFLRDRETGDRVDLVYAVTSIRQEAGDPLPAPTVDWVDTIRLGTATETDALARACGTFGAAGAAAALPQGFAMAASDAVVVAEVCMKLRASETLTRLFAAGNIRRLHALPVRQADTRLPAPAYAPATT